MSFATFATLPDRFGWLYLAAGPEFVAPRVIVNADVTRLGGDAADGRKDPPRTV